MNRTVAAVACATTTLALAACVEFQGPSPVPAPWIRPPSDLPIHFGSCDGSRPTGPRCIWFRHVRPNQDDYYVRGQYDPERGRCGFYPQFGDVYIGDEWEGHPTWLRVFTAPAAC